VTVALVLWALVAPLTLGRGLEKTQRWVPPRAEVWLVWCYRRSLGQVVDDPGQRGAKVMDCGVS